MFFVLLISTLLGIALIFTIHCLPRIFNNELVDAHTHHPEARRERAIDKAFDVLYLDRLDQLVELPQFLVALEYELAVIIVRLVDKMVHFVDV